MFTAEAQHGTLATALTAQPARWVIALSKATMAAAVGLVLGAVGMVAGAVGAVAVGLPAGDTSAVPATALAALRLHCAGRARSGSVSAWSSAQRRRHLRPTRVVVRRREPASSALAPAEVGRFLPFDAGSRLLQVGGAYDTPEILDAQLARPQLALVFGAYAAVAMVVGTILLYRRDSR